MGKIFQNFIAPLVIKQLSFQIGYSQVCLSQKWLRVYAKNRSVMTNSRHWSRTHRAQGPHPPRDLIRKISFQHGEEDVNSQTGNRAPRSAVPFAFTLATPPEPYTSRMEEGLDDDAQPPGDEVFENAGCRGI